VRENCANLKGEYMKKIILICLALPSLFQASSSFADQGVPDGPIRVMASVAELSDGGHMYTYQLPDGSVLEVPSPPANFNPQIASAEDLELYQLPSRPSDLAELANWNSTMHGLTFGSVPDAFIDTFPNTDPVKAGTVNFGNWGGYYVGNANIRTNKYVAVKGNFVVPTVYSQCNGGQKRVTAWVGLGGVNSNYPNSLVQQGIAWCNQPTGQLLGKWNPFLEFANSSLPVAFCGSSTWEVFAGDTIYNNMSFQSSNNKAFFYMEDQTTQTYRSCSLTPPQGWSFDGTTAEWIVEEYLDNNGDQIPLANYGTLTFTNALTQLASTSAWVTLASQTETKIVTGYTNHYTQMPSALTPSGSSFIMDWVRLTY
jgi:hypothetical protein